MKIRSMPQPVVSSVCFHPYPTFPRRGGRLPSAPPLDGEDTGGVNRSRSPISKEDTKSLARQSRNQGRAKQKSLYRFLSYRRKPVSMTAFVLPTKAYCTHTHHNPASMDSGFHRNDGQVTTSLPTLVVKFAQTVETFIVVRRLKL
jgi:hypothetical protein